MGIYSPAAFFRLFVTTLEEKPIMPQGTFVAEREWARTLARHVANQLQEAARQLPDLQLPPDQLERLRQALENTLITNMGCETPPS